jgi:phage terminase small subunit
LTQQEELLVQNILKGYPKSMAGREAGYNFNSMKQGVDRILKKPVVRERIDALRMELSRRAQTTQEDVLEGFKDAINDAKLAGDPGNQIAGWREIAKILGYYAPERKEVEISHQHQQAQEQLASLSEDDLIKLAGGDVIDGEFELLGND